MRDLMRNSEEDRDVSANRKVVGSSMKTTMGIQNSGIQDIKSLQRERTLAIAERKRDGEVESTLHTCNIFYGWA
jgi:hypothetical protein